MKNFIKYLFIIILFLLLFPSPLFAVSPTLEDFWDNQAYFKFQNKFSFPTDGQFAWLGMNMGTSVIVKDNTWYVFTREYDSSRPSYCLQDYARIVVRSSIDQGKTWSDKTTIIDIIPNSPNECASIDGDAYFDTSTRTWHYIYQCMARDRKWNLCYASHQGETPFALFNISPNNPVIRAGDLWKRICPPEGRCLSNLVFDEGTPEIVEKRGSDFYVTFHGYDGINAYRGLAKTTDFFNWQTANNSPIFDKNDCQNWNVPWDSHGCVGGALATILKENSYYYMLIEAMDKNLVCTDNQNWVFGMVRSPILENKNWENISNNPLVFSSKEKDANGITMRCGIQYQRLFRDSNGDIYLLYGRLGNRPAIDTDSITGIYLYKLERNLPFASYKFREGHGHEFTRSDIISRGNLEAKTTNVSWINKDDNTNILQFNGVNSQMEIGDNPIFNFSGDFTIKMDLKLLSLLTQNQKSALIAGKVGSYWIELYQNGDLCGWVQTPQTQQPVCQNISGQLNTWFTIQFTKKNNNMYLYVNNIMSTLLITDSALALSDNRFKLGNLSPDANGFYGSFNGQFGFLDIYSYAFIAPTPTPLTGDLDHNGKVDIFDYNLFVGNFGNTTCSNVADLNGTCTVDIFDYNILVGNFGK